MTAWRKGVWMLVLGMGVVGCSGGKSPAGAGVVDDGSPATGDDSNGDGTPGDVQQGDALGSDGDGDGDAVLSGADASVPYPVNAQGQVLCGTAPCAC